MTEYTERERHLAAKSLDAEMLHDICRDPTYEEAMQVICALRREALRDISRLSEFCGHQGRVTWIEEIRERWGIKP